MKLGYSKINIIDTHNKSRSLDHFSFSSSSDLPIMSFRRTRSKTPFDRIIQTHNIADQMETGTTTTNTTTKTTYEYMTSSSSSSSSPKKRDEDDHKGEEEEEEDVGENIIGKADHDKAAYAAAVLRRNCSVSSISASAVKRVFSMRRSSSVSESYCRIHDQSVTLASPIDDEEEQEDKMRSAKKKHRGGKILKACKRFFGLH